MEPSRGWPTVNLRCSRPIATHGDVRAARPDNGLAIRTPGMRRSPRHWLHCRKLGCEGERLELATTAGRERPLLSIADAGKAVTGSPPDAPSPLKLRCPCSAFGPARTSVCGRSRGRPASTANTAPQKKHPPRRAPCNERSVELDPGITSRAAPPSSPVPSPCARRASSPPAWPPHASPAAPPSRTSRSPHCAHRDPPCARSRPRGSRH